MIKHLEQDAEYLKIVSVIEKLDVSGLLDRLPGNCIAACDLLQNFLYQVGIQSKIVEVQLSMSNNNPEKFNKPDIMFVGFDGLAPSGQIDTHVIIITETKIPFLIDVSIRNWLPEPKKYIFEPLNYVKNSIHIISEYDYDGFYVVYQNKKVSRYPILHQKNVIERMLEDQKNKRNFKIVSFVAIVSLIVTLINMILNSGLLYLKFMLG
jgi:hypothetical protein